MSDFDNDNGDIVTLKTADGEEIDFYKVARSIYDGNHYAILQPVEPLEGMDDDEALVFKVTKNADGTNKFTIEEDVAIIEDLYAEYTRLLNEAEQD